MKILNNKTFLLNLFIFIFLVINGCSFDSNKSILAEQNIEGLSRIVLIETSKQPGFKFVTDFSVLSIQPKWAPSKNNFAFISIQNNKKLLWISDENGTNIQITNHNNRNVENFEWAPNSKEIAVEFEPDNSEGNVFLYSIENKSFLPITRIDKKAKLGSWSPDSNWIVYNIQDSIYLSNPKGVNEIFITKGHNPKWSPNGQYLIFNRLENNILNLWIYKDVDKVVEKTGKEIEGNDYSGEKVFTKDIGKISEYTWAYRGNKILYSSSLDNNNEIYILDIKSKKIDRLTNNKVNENNLVWSERYKSIIFTSNAHGQSDIYKMNGDGTSQEIILNSKEIINSLDW